MDPIFNPLTTMAAAVALAFVFDHIITRRDAVLWDVEWINEHGLRRRQFFAEDLSSLQHMMNDAGIDLRTVVSVRQTAVSS